METERATGRSSWARGVNWWLMLIGPAVLVGVVVSTVLMQYAYDMWAYYVDEVAPYMVAAAAAIFAVRTALTRNPLHLILTVLILALLCREIHFTGTGKGIYAALVIISVWTVLWRKKIAEPMRDYRLVSWLIAAAWTYFMAYLVGQRLFSAKHIAIIPNEKAIHTCLEEVVETAGHVLLIVSAVVGSWRRAGRPDKGALKNEE